jgi:hypothetical protein
MDRDSLVIELRPEISSALITDNMTPEERFQNEVIRPILKVQHNLIITLFNAHLNKHNRRLSQVDEITKTELIAGILNKDISLRNILIGCICGLFTIDELKAYYNRENEFRQRIVRMLVKRIVSGL